MREGYMNVMQHGYNKKSKNQWVCDSKAQTIRIVGESSNWETRGGLKLSAEDYSFCWGRKPTGNAQ